MVCVTIIIIIIIIMVEDFRTQYAFFNGSETYCTENFFRVRLLLAMHSITPLAAEEVGHDIREIKISVR